MRTHLLIFLSVLFLTMNLASCGKNDVTQGTAAAPAANSNNGPTPASTTTTTGPEALEGTWTTACQTNWQMPYQLRLTFSRGAVAETVVFFRDAQCTRGMEASYPEVFYGWYQPGRPLPSGLYELNLSNAVGNVAPFTVFKISGSTLTLGDTAGGMSDGMTWATRPQATNDSVAFTKI